MFYFVDKAGNNVDEHAVPRANSRGRLSGFQMSKTNGLETAGAFNISHISVNYAQHPLNPRQKIHDFSFYLAICVELL